MGGGSSSVKNADTTAVSTSSSNKPHIINKQASKDLEKVNSNKSILETDTFNDFGGFDTNLSNDLDASAQSKLSANNKLKRLALGTPGYKDQQRDNFDNSISKMEFNKTGQINWSPPADNNKFHINTNIDLNAKTIPLDSKPAKTPNNSSSTTPKYGNTPSRPPTIGNKPPPPNSKFTFDQQTINSNNILSPHQNNSVPPTYQKILAPSYGKEGDNSVNSSFSSVASASHSQGNLISKPFPIKNPSPSQQDKQDADIDEMMADFSPARGVIVGTPHRKPDTVPMLSLVSSSSSGTLNSLSDSTSQSGLNTQHSVPAFSPHHNVSTNMSNAQLLSNGIAIKGNIIPAKPPPQQQHPAPPGHPGPPPTSNGKPVPTTPVPSNLTIQTNDRVITPNDKPISLPIVKETKDIKRNRAQIPQKLTHARPTTGDWLNNRYIVNNYILLDILGTGSYGEVRLCKDRVTDKLFAIKIISKDFLKKRKNSKSTETYFEDIKREIAIMKKLLHPNVLQLFEVLDDPNVNKMYLVLEYMKMGDLVNILKRRPLEDAKSQETDASKNGFIPLSDLEVWNIFRQVVSGIKYLHLQNVVHGDIKPQNLLLGEDGIVKIADFGISHMLSASGQKLADAAGTPAFMSPELCEGKSSFSGQLADIWAIGATMFMLRFGHPPFTAKNIINLYSKIINDTVEFPFEIDPGLKNLLLNMLEKDPEKRYTLQQIMNHPWLRHRPLIHSMVSMQRPDSGNRGPPPNFIKGPSPRIDATQAGNHNRPLEVMGKTKSMLTFMPPPSYDAEEAAAMKEITSVDNNDIFKSIGGIVEVSTHEEPSHLQEVIEVDYDDDDDDDDNKESQKSKVVTDKGKSQNSNGDIMNTNWGDDVFGIVEHGDELDDDDSDDDSAANETGGMSKKDSKTSLSKDESNKTMSTTKSRSEMSHEEEMRRSKRFLQQSREKKNSDVSLTLKANTMGTITEDLNIDSNKAYTTPLRKANNIDEGSSRRNSSPTKSSVRSVRGSVKSVGDNAEEETDELTMDDFNKMMDTLALQPKLNKNASLDIDDEDNQSDRSYNKDGVISMIKNSHNGIAAAYHSEIGNRHSQEDRCILIPNVADMQIFENKKLDQSLTDLNIVNKFTIGCVFDGHNGSRCSQYLYLHLPTMLVSHPKFFTKQCDIAIIDTCKTIDYDLCKILNEENNASGSTGVICIYDGRKHLFTVAGIGDSMCVLSRGGRAVMLNKMHRLDVEAERERIKKAGGTVLNSRVNGILAVSRAFGDTQFKGEETQDGSYNGRLVIAEPELCSEIITPMTEFAIIATDGLWDVISPQVAVSYVRKLLNKNSDLQEAAKAITREAINKGSVDNTTALIISFHSS